MTEDMMNEIADAYAEAAFMAKFAGVDMVMVHGGHGWLLDQFLSPLNNKRTDKYGGSLGKPCPFSHYGSGQGEGAVRKEFSDRIPYFWFRAVEGGLEGGGNGCLCSYDRG